MKKNSIKLEHFLEKFISILDANQLSKFRFIYIIIMGISFL